MNWSNIPFVEHHWLTVAPDVSQVPVNVYVFTQTIGLPELPLNWIDNAFETESYNGFGSVNNTFPVVFVTPVIGYTLLQVDVE